MLLSRIACLSAPSVYQKLKQGVVEGSDGVSAVVLEYDRRFATYGQEFIFYDYNEPLALPEDVAPQSFDFVLADPPYLSEECLNKVAQTVKYLAKGKVLLCTGEPHIAVSVLGLVPFSIPHTTLNTGILTHTRMTCRSLQLLKKSNILCFIYYSFRSHHGGACREFDGSEDMQLPA